MDIEAIVKPPGWLTVAGALGLLWNAYGMVQFYGTLTATRAAMMGMGMTPAQADIYARLPVWMNVVFAIGVVGGFVGCVLLLLRRKVAVPVLAASLAGYIALYAGDIIHGVFAAFGTPQIAVLTTVVIIAAGLLFVARFYTRRGVLT